MNLDEFVRAHALPIKRAMGAVARAGLCTLVMGVAITDSAKAQNPPSLLDAAKQQSKPVDVARAVKDASDKEWVIEVTPYIWFTGVSGTIRPFASERSIEFDESFSDVLEDLNGAFFLAAYARKGRLIFAGDFSFVDLSHEGVVPPDIEATGSLRQLSLTLAVGYQAVEKKKMILDLLVGFRTWLLKPSVEAEAGGVDVSREKSFTDIVLATRRKFRISDDWSILLYADVGVFRVGSHATSQFVGTVTYQASRDFFLSLGYRHLSVDYRQDGTEVDVRLSGPLIGATWRF